MPDKPTDLTHDKPTDLTQSDETRLVWTSTISTSQNGKG